MQDAQGSRKINLSQEESNQNSLIAILQHYLKVSDDLNILSEE
jgi:hypothetical protein